jgi:hypothetical protein
MYLKSLDAIHFYALLSTPRVGMRFVLHRSIQAPAEYWNGSTALPDEIAVPAASQRLAEFQLLATICGLHGAMSAWDLLTGCDADSEKDRDMVAVLTAVKWYVWPAWPLSGYTEEGRRGAVGRQSL